MARIYITHCSAKKEPTLKDSGRLVTPDVLYVATPTKRFMVQCQYKGVSWAIFSDLYGIWFPYETHEWYEKNPNSVTTSEFLTLCANFDQRLADYSEIWFYHNPGRFHPLYKTLLRTVTHSSIINPFSHLRQVC